jgi:hypothetical protein
MLTIRKILAAAVAAAVIVASVGSYAADQNVNVGAGLVKKMRDMADGTYAEVVSATTNGAFVEVPFTTATVQTVASTDAALYRWVSVHLTSQGTSSTVTFQGSNDNSNWVSVALHSQANVGVTIPAVSTTSSGVIMAGPVNYRYFRLNVTGISAGTTAGTVEFFAVPPSLVSPPQGTFLADNADSIVASATANGMKIQNRNTIFSGTNWDRALNCPNSAVINVTAANTTQIVGLVAAQTVRICSFAVSMSASGTAKFVYGTGTNCATGTTDMTGAMTLATGVPLAMGDANGGALLKTASANALCVTAATGNVVGFVNYAQF